MSGKRKKKLIQEKRRQRREAEGEESPRWDALVASGEVIMADLSKQAPNNSWSPRTYYRDQEFTCKDCGAVEVWTARQQQWWYEVAKGPIYSSAVRCRACRQKRRAEREEQRRRSQAGQANGPET